MRDSLFFFVNKTALCIANWQPLITSSNARSDGPSGLPDLIRSKALIDEALWHNRFLLKGGLWCKIAAWLATRLIGGLGVRRQILSSENTLSEPNDYASCYKAIFDSLEFKCTDSCLWVGLKEVQLVGMVDPKTHSNFNMLTI